MPRTLWRSWNGPSLDRRRRIALPATEQPMLTPSTDLLRRAFAAGFESIDDGDTFYLGFNGYLSAAGYARRDDIPCTCPDQGAHGHQPECRWVRAE